MLTNSPHPKGLLRSGRHPGLGTQMEPLTGHVGGEQSMWPFHLRPLTPRDGIFVVKERGLERCISESFLYRLKIIKGEILYSLALLLHERSVLPGLSRM